MDLPPTEPLPPRDRPDRERSRTEPLPGRPSEAQPARPGRSVSGAWVGAGILVLLIAFVLGFLAGRTRGGEPVVEPERQRGGKASARCGRALSLALDAMELQRQALANRTEYARALLEGDEEAAEALNDALEPISERLEQVQTQVGPAVVRCRGGRDGG